MAASVEVGSHGSSSGRPSRLFTHESRIVHYDVTADGQRIPATVEDETQQQAEPIHVVLNWDLEVGKLAAEARADR